MKLLDEMGDREFQWFVLCLILSIAMLASLALTLN
jgi:hypothetical protein